MDCLDRFTRSIDLWGMKAQGGEPLPLADDPLAKVLQRATRRGVPVLAALTQLRAEAASATAFLRRRRGLERLAAFRLVLAGGFAGAGRAWLTAGDVLPRSGADALALAGALLVAGTFQLVVRRHLPLSWFWHGGLSPEALLWLRALLGERVAPAPLLAALERFREEELRRGVSRSAVRQALLADHAARRREGDADALARLEAAWPLVELLGVGLPVLLVLAGPVGLMYHG